MTSGLIDADVAAVGAGVAGLVAAGDLVPAGHEVVVVEARGRVGGRLLNAELPDGKPIEAGGQWVGPSQLRVRAVLAELGLSTHPTYDQGRHILELDGRRQSYTGRIPPLGLVGLGDFAQGQWRLNRAAATIDPREPWAAPQAHELDGQTFGTWVNRRFRTLRARAFIRIITEAVFAAEPEDMSALWALSYISAAGGLDALINTRGGAQQERVVGGTQRIAVELADLLGDRVMLNQPVRQVNWNSGGVFIRAGGVQVRARRAIIAVPQALSIHL